MTSGEQKTFVDALRGVLKLSPLYRIRRETTEERFYAWDEWNESRGTGNRQVGRAPTTPGPISRGGGLISKPKAWEPGHWVKNAIRHRADKVRACLARGPARFVQKKMRGYKFRQTRCERCGCSPQYHKQVAA